MEHSHERQQSSPISRYPLAVVQDLPIPEPGPGEVLVRMETSGLCHTDIHAAHGDWPVKPTPPFIPGTKASASSSRSAPGVTAAQVGDRVAIAWLGYACGQCRYCIDGWETLCEKQHNTGYSVNGAFAEYAVVPAAFATPVPDGGLLLRRRAADLRRGHHVQGRQGRPGRARRRRSRSSASAGSATSPCSTPGSSAAS